MQFTDGIANHLWRISGLKYCKESYVFNGVFELCGLDLEMTIRVSLVIGNLCARFRLPLILKLRVKRA